MHEVRMTLENNKDQIGFRKPVRWQTMNMSEVIVYPKVIKI